MVGFSTVRGSGVRVQFRLLGNIEAWLDGQVVEIGYAQLRSVLAVLLVEANRVVPVDQLVDSVWGTRSLPRRPRARIQHGITMLRTALAPIPQVGIAWQAVGYQLTVDPDTIDLYQFRQLSDQARDTPDDVTAIELFGQAMRLWRGEPFTGLDTPWFNAQRTALSHHRTAARHDLTDLRLRHGQHTALLPELSEWTRQHPLDERLAGQFMLALYRSGQPAHALEHYRELRGRLAEDLGTDPTPSLQHLHQQILTAAPALAAPTRPTTPALAPVPRQLPAAPRLFTGREPELAALTAALDDDAESGRTVVITAIGGLGGIGKTWLALHWAHHNLDRFPDGQLHVNLRGFDPAGTPMSPSSALRGFLEALGVDPATIPAELDAQVGLYRSVVATKRLLVVLDNARDTTQVAPLLPTSPGCTVLVTSRDRLAGLVAAHGARPLTVDVLPDLDARRLLADRVGAQRLAAEPDTAEELLSCCGGLPLALSIVAGRVAAQPRFSLAELTGELQGAATRLDALDDSDPVGSLPAVQSWSYQALTPEQARVFGLLGLAPGPDIGLPAAASLTALPVARARIVLRELTNASLVQQHLPGRWRMHDLVRLYAADRAGRDLPADDRSAALRRLVDFYLHTSYAGERLLSPHAVPITPDPPADGCVPHQFADADEALAWFVVEHPGILAGQQLAVAQGWDVVVWQVAWALHSVHYRRGYLSADLACWRTALAAAERLDDPAVRIRTHRRLGHAYSRLGRRPEGRAHLEQALALAEQIGDVREQAGTHNVLASTCGGLGDVPRALDHATEAVRLFRVAGQPVGEADALSAVGMFSVRLGRYDEARVACVRALALARRHGDYDSEGDALDVLGYLAHTLGRHTEAIDYYDQALILFRDRGDTVGEAFALGRLGEAFAAGGQRAEARAVWRRAVELFGEQHRAAEVDRVQRLLTDLEQHAAPSVLGA